MPYFCFTLFLSLPPPPIFIIYIHPYIDTLSRWEEKFLPRCLVSTYLWWDFLGERYEANNHWTIFLPRKFDDYINHYGHFPGSAQRWTGCFLVPDQYEARSETTIYLFIILEMTFHLFIYLPYLVGRNWLNFWLRAKISFE